MKISTAQSEQQCDQMKTVFVTFTGNGSEKKINLY